MVSGRLLNKGDLQKADTRPFPSVLQITAYAFCILVLNLPIKTI